MHAIHRFIHINDDIDENRMPRIFCYSSSWATLPHIYTWCRQCNSELTVPENTIVLLALFFLNSFARILWLPMTCVLAFLYGISRERHCALDLCFQNANHSPAVANIISMHQIPVPVGFQFAAKLTLYRCSFDPYYASSWFHALL